MPALKLVSPVVAPIDNFGSDEEEYAQDWRDEQDDLFGKLREVRNRIESEVEGYTDLHENDVVLESFLGESKR